MNTTTSTSTPTLWTLDPTHSSVGFSVRHMMITNVRGEFQKFAGEVAYDPADPGATRISATIDVASIHTREAARDAHLRSPDFFNAEQYPTINFNSRSVDRAGDGLVVVGDLSIRGVSREVRLTVDEMSAQHTDPWGNQRIGAAAKTKIRRSEFGITWNTALELGGVLVGDEITIHIEASLVRQAAK
jgi:polyisoprenoid-binding protein YceI